LQIVCVKQFANCLCIKPLLQQCDLSVHPDEYILRISPCCVQKFLLHGLCHCYWTPADATISVPCRRPEDDRRTSSAASESVSLWWELIPGTQNFEASAFDMRYIGSLRYPRADTRHWCNKLCPYSDPPVSAGSTAHTRRTGIPIPPVSSRTAIWFSKMVFDDSSWASAPDTRPPRF